MSATGHLAILPQDCYKWQIECGIHSTFLANNHLYRLATQIILDSLGYSCLFVFLCTGGQLQVSNSAGTANR